MSAVISDCGTYRYVLTREFLTGRGTVVFVMLNPSTADATADDPTIRRCVSFTRRLGCKKLSVVNLFAARSTDPKNLSSFADPVGPDNDEWIRREVEDAYIVVAAWGAHKMAKARSEEVLRMIRGNKGHTSRRPHCLGVTKAGNPRHPLYVKSDVAIKPLSDFTHPTDKEQNDGD